jgi:hypothetical protein
MIRNHLTSVKLTSVGKDAEKRKHLCTVGGSIYLYSVAILKNNVDVSQKSKNRTTICSNSTTGPISKVIEIFVPKICLYSHMCFSIIHKS